MALKQWLLAGLLASTCLVSIAAAGPIENYSPVTADRLKNPEPGNWMHYRRTYDGQGYSTLDQINTSNVKNLVPVWTFSTGVVEGHQAPPIINNGVMFVSTPEGQVIALNAKTGDEYWRYKRQLPEDLFQLHPTNRGVGLWQDKLYLATTDDHLVALDAKTGKVVWDTKVQDYKKGQYLTLMPLVVDGKVIVGGSGGEFGIRGYIVAYDANTGKELWRTFTIPGPGEPGHETWSGDDWKTGGAPAWMTGTYDVDTRTIYWGTGNAAPWPGETHPGDNLYSTSVLALDPDSGKIKFPVPSKRFLGLGRGGRTDADRPAKGRPHHQESGPSGTQCDFLGARAQAGGHQICGRLAVRLYRRLEGHRAVRQANCRSRSQARCRQAG
jgi:alcohol dehydrogenase (cytochrome c)